MKTPIFSFILATAVLCLASFSFGSRATVAGPPLAASGVVTLPVSKAWVDVVQGVGGELIAVHDFRSIYPWANLQIIDSAGTITVLPFATDDSGSLHFEHGIILRQGETLQCHTNNVHGVDSQLFWSARLVR